jgi:hypothetical protein
VTPIVCCGCHQKMGEDPRDYPRPKGCEEIQAVSHDLCDDCLRKLYPTLAEMVIGGKAKLVTKEAKA